MLTVCNEVVFNWSRSRDPNKENAVKYSEEPTLKLKDWTEAYQWARMNHKNLISNGEFFYTGNRFDISRF